MQSQLVDIATISRETGFSEPEIRDLVDRKLIPYLKFADLGLRFPLEEILARGIKKTAGPPETKTDAKGETYVAAPPEPIQKKKASK